MELALNIIRTLACFYVIYVSLLCINRMSRCTNHVVRTAFILLAGGALSEVVFIWEFGHIKPLLGFSIYQLLDTARIVGVAIYVGVSQRRRIQGDGNETCT
jgi:hypothetical protein